MSYKSLGDELSLAYLILERSLNYVKENYSEDQHLSGKILDLKNHCGDVMRAIGYSEPKVDK